MRCWILIAFFSVNVIYLFIYLFVCLLACLLACLLEWLFVCFSSSCLIWFVVRRYPMPPTSCPVTSGTWPKVLSASQTFSNPVRLQYCGLCYWHLLLSTTTCRWDQRYFHRRGRRPETIWIQSWSRFVICRGRWLFVVRKNNWFPYAFQLGFQWMSHGQRFVNKRIIYNKIDWSHYSCNTQSTLLGRLCLKIATYEWPLGVYITIIARWFLFHFPILVTKNKTEKVRPVKFHLLHYNAQVQQEFTNVSEKYLEIN
jgi:hypothetical protein